MNKRKKMVVKIVAVAAIICAVSLVLPLPFNPWHPVGIVAMAFRAGRIRVRLLSETDHQVLLEACGEVMNGATLSLVGDIGSILLSPLQRYHGSLGQL